MATLKGRKRAGNATGADIGYEAELWRMADALRGSTDAAEYKHVVLGLIFLKYISDAFQEQHARLEAQADDGEPFQEKMQRLVAQLRQQQVEAARLDAAIARNLASLGYPLDGESPP